MNVYVVFDRYERNEWINVFYVGTDREESIKHCKEIDLPNFLEYGPTTVTRSNQLKLR